MFLYVFLFISTFLKQNVCSVSVLKFSAVHLLHICMAWPDQRPFCTLKVFLHNDIDIHSWGLIRYQLVKVTLPDSFTTNRNEYTKHFISQATLQVTRYWRCQSTLNSFSSLPICVNGNEFDFTHKDRNQYINMYVHTP